MSCTSHLRHACSPFFVLVLLHRPGSDLCWETSGVLPARAFPAHGWTRHNLCPGCRPAQSAASSCPALRRAGAFYAPGDGPITRPGGRNSAFVMVVISLLCSQVELRWNSTGSHCVPIFRTLKEICWVLKGWNEARRASADLALWGNTQWEQSCPSVSFCARLNLSQCCPFAAASF